MISNSRKCLEKYYFRLLNLKNSPLNAREFQVICSVASGFFTTFPSEFLWKVLPSYDFYYSNIKSSLCNQPSFNFFLSLSLSYISPYNWNKKRKKSHFPNQLFWWTYLLNWQLLSVGFWGCFTGIFTFSTIKL